MMSSGTIKVNIQGLGHHASVHHPPIPSSPPPQPIPLPPPPPINVKPTRNRCARTQPPILGRGLHPFRANGCKKLPTHPAQPPSQPPIHQSWVRTSCTEHRRNMSAGGRESRIQIKPSSSFTERKPIIQHY
jgi:hypothetical protein